MAYDFKDLPAFKGVWVFCEQRGGEMMPTDEELLSRARVLADELGVSVVEITKNGGNSYMLTGTLEESLKQEAETDA